MSAGETMATASDDKGALPWTMVPRFTPGVTDVMEWTKKLKFLSELWPKDQLSALTTRVALQCEGTAFERISRLSPEKLKVNDLSGIKLIVETVGGSWGQTALEERYEFFERAIYGVQQKSDESHDSYLSRHDICFDELLSQGTTFEELRAYVLVRQSLLSSEDKKRIVIEHQGALSYDKVKASIRLLGSKFFGELQGSQRSQAKSLRRSTSRRMKRLFNQSIWHLGVMTQSQTSTRPSWTQWWPWRTQTRCTSRGLRRSWRCTSKRLLRCTRPSRVTSRPVRGSFKKRSVAAFGRWAPAQRPKVAGKAASLVVAARASIRGDRDETSFCCGFPGLHAVFAVNGATGKQSVPSAPERPARMSAKRPPRPSLRPLRMSPTWPFLRDEWMLR